MIDGHEDFPIHYVKAKPVWSLDAHDFSARMPGQVDLPRLREGHVGATLVTLGSDRAPEQGGHYPRVLVSFDWLDGLIARHPAALMRATSPDDLDEAARTGRIALIPAIEAGDQIDGSIENLRGLHARGLRAMTLIYDHDNDLGEGANAFVASRARRRPDARGLTPLGREVVVAMNDLGMLIDLSHAASATALDAIRASRAPVIFSHSNARTLADTPRNVPDDVLRALAKNGGVLMLTPVPYLTTQAHWRWWDSGERRYAELKSASSDRAAIGKGMSEWEAANPQPVVTIADFADQIDHVARVAGKDHVGLGSDFDGMGDYVIAGLEDASTIPALFAELARRGWNDVDMAKLSRGNFTRVWRQASALATRPR